jgi:site-specific DNA recombinase
MPICAIYARVSDASQVKGDSIEHQIAFCREIARRKGIETGTAWETPSQLVYVDQGISGTSLIRREAVARLIADAQTHRFQTVLFKGISRFARDTVDALVMLRTLLAAGVRVLSMEENFDSQRDRAEFVFTIHSALAQAESEKTAVRVRMGAAEKARQGKWNGQAPDGYVLDPQTQKLVIDPVFAETIREVFRLYLRGQGSHRIADTLNRRGERTKRGYLWNQRSVARILQNPVYVGDVWYGRREKRLAPPDAASPLKRRFVSVKVKDETSIVVCNDAHPAIIDRLDFQRVAAMMAERHRRPGRHGQLQLLSGGLMKCRCGSSMTIKYNSRGTRYYRCVGQMNRGKTLCDQRYLPADEVETAVLSRISADATPILTLSHMHLTEHGRPSHPDQATVRQRLETVLQKSEFLFSQFAAGRLSVEQFERLNQVLRRQISNLRRRADSDLQAKQVTPRQAELLIQAAIKGLLSRQTEDMEMTRQLLQRLVQRVQVTADGLEIWYRFGPIPDI